MKLIIKDVDYQQNIFYGHINNRKQGFYLTKKLAHLFMDYIKVGYLVEFEITKKTKTIKGRKCLQVNHFKLIRNLKTSFDYYNHYHLQSEMIDFLDNHDHFLFLDLEMSIGYFGQKNYIPEIIQYGYYLIDSKGEVIKQGDNYLLTTLTKRLTPRTFSFLKLNRDTYFKEAVNYKIFYDEIKTIIDNYYPKIVVWGKNDIRAINHYYKINKLKPLTNNLNFIDLLNLHKDFFNLKNDLGLFAAYKEYYGEETKQIHNAKEDAKITKKVFDAFYTYAKNLIEDY